MLRAKVIDFETFNDFGNFNVAMLCFRAGVLVTGVSGLLVIGVATGGTDAVEIEHAAAEVEPMPAVVKSAGQFVGALAPCAAMYVPTGAGKHAIDPAAVVKVPIAQRVATAA